MLEDSGTERYYGLTLLGFVVGVGLFIWEDSRTYFDIECIEGFLHDMKGFQCELSSYFFFLLYKRGLFFCIIFFLGLSKCTRIFKYPCFVLMGAAIGFLFAKLLHLYGAKGLVFFLGLLLPHIPIYYWVIYKIWDLTNISAKYSDRIYDFGRRRTNNGNMLQIMTTTMVAIIGVILECYVNLFFLKKIIIFFM